mmetsp:Transcript_8360/g.29720  ORF Transcript_8360/g.29720 Transcript_8360/m.29720 type:complete len:204 (-) Transcript_8360:682-1293(-)
MRLRRPLAVVGRHVLARDGRVRWLLLLLRCWRPRRGGLCDARPERLLEAADVVGDCGGAVDGRTQPHHRRHRDMEGRKLFSEEDQRRPHGRRRRSRRITRRVLRCHCPRASVPARGLVVRWARLRRHKRQRLSRALHRGDVGSMCLLRWRQRDGAVLLRNGLLLEPNGHRRAGEGRVSRHTCCRGRRRRQRHRRHRSSIGARG